MSPLNIYVKNTIPKKSGVVCTKIFIVFCFDQKYYCVFTAFSFIFPDISTKDEYILCFFLKE